jgi:hypothetical protein
MERSRATGSLALVAVLMLDAVGAWAVPVAAPVASTPGLVATGPTLVFDERVNRTLDLPTQHLQQARRRMLDGQQIPWADMRELADHGDGLAAFRLAQRIESRNDPSLLGDAAFYYATAAYTDRDYAVGPLVRILRRGDVEFTPRRLDHIENSLRALALAGDQRAAEALTGFYASGHPFGRQPEKALEFRLALAEAGDADAALNLVIETMSGTAPVHLDPAQVQRLLEVASTSDDLGLRIAGENLRRKVGAQMAATPTAVATVRPVARPAQDTQSNSDEAAP